MSDQPTPCFQPGLRRHQGLRVPSAGGPPRCTNCAFAIPPVLVDEGDEERRIGWRSETEVADADERKLPLTGTLRLRNRRAHLLSSRDFATHQSRRRLGAIAHLSGSGTATSGLGGDTSGMPNTARAMFCARPSGPRSEFVNTTTFTLSSGKYMLAVVNPLMPPECPIACGRAFQP